MIKTGSIQLPSGDPTAGTIPAWNLSSPGIGDRSYVSPDIPYVPLGAPPSPFGSTPTVVVSLAGVAATGDLSRLRVSLSVENVQVEEFNIRVTAYEDCTLERVWVTWVAYDGN